MKIAIVHDFLTKIGGAERVLSTFHDIYPNAPIYTLLYDKEGTKSLFTDPSYNIIPSYLNKYPSFLRRKPKLFLGKLSKAIEQFDFSEYDVVISFSSAYSHGILTKPKTLHICYCYSPMRYVWDWYHEYMAENSIGFGLVGLYIRSLLSSVRIWDQVSSHRVDRWLTQSNTAKYRIKKYYNSHATVIYPPTDLSKISPSSKPPKDYFLIISRLEPYKKIDLTVGAFNKINKPLVIIGEGSDRKRLEKMANKNISFLGWQSDESIKKYMQDSFAFIFPGEEDYGLTPIESMASGRPVVAYNKGGVTETVVEGETGIFFNEQSVNSIIEAIERLSKNYHNLTPEKCRQRAELFSKERFCQEIKNYIENAYKEHTNNYESN